MDEYLAAAIKRFEASIPRIVTSLDSDDPLTKADLDAVLAAAKRGKRDLGPSVSTGKRDPV